MGLAQTIDQIAVKAAGIAGIAGASGAGVTAGVSPNPGLEMPTTPYAVVWLSPGTVVQGTLTTFTEQAEVRVYVPLANPGGAYALLLGFPDLFDVAWDTDRDLGGTCVDSGFERYGKVDREDWAGVSYLFIPIYIGFTRLRAADLSP